jgi:hypothetical protein
MGINEAGLCYDTNWIPRETLTPETDFIPLDEWAVTYLMKECSTVEEVLSQVFQFNWGDSMSYQIHFADATGDAVVIHPGPDGHITSTRKPSGDGYLVSTNFNLERLKTGDYSCNRYETAESMLHSMSDLSVEFMASVLDANHMEGEVSTIYSMVYDLPERLIYLYYEHMFDQPLVMDVAETLEGGDRQVPIEELFAETAPNDDLLVPRLLENPATIPIIVVLGISAYLVYRGRKMN